MAIVFCFTMMPTAVLAVDDGETKPIEATASDIGMRTESTEEAGDAQEDSALPETENKEISTPAPLPITEEESSKVEAEPHSETENRSETLVQTAKAVANAAPIEYIDADGKTAVCTDYIALTGDPEGNKLGGTEQDAWYVVSGSISATADWTLEGNVNIILTDGSVCNTDGHFIDLKDKSVLTIYGQSEGTGSLTVSNSTPETDMISALGGPSPAIFENGTVYWHVELGSLILCGGNVVVESAKYIAVNLKNLSVFGGTLTAKAPNPYAAISLSEQLQTIPNNYKVCMADEPQIKISYGNGLGIKVLITKCTEHKWGYASSETAGMHKLACELCSVYSEEAHNYCLSGGVCNEMRHYLKCACGAVSTSPDFHTFEYIANSDTLTHNKVCTFCKYVLTENEQHDFRNAPTLCDDCGFKRGASVLVGETLINYEMLTQAIDIAAGSRNDKTNGIVTLYGGEECFPRNENNPDKPDTITIRWGKFTIDFNGANLSLPGITLFDIQKEADVTLKNGTVNLSGDTTYNDNPGIMDRSGGLTLIDFNITSSCKAGNEHIQYPAVKVLYNFTAQKTFTAENVVFNGGFEARNGVTVTPFTSGSFVRSCAQAACDEDYPVISVGGDITDIIADGYALAKYDNPSVLVPMYQYNEDGVRVKLSKILESVTVVAHPQHIFEQGYCACGYKCDHADGFDDNQKCKICRASAIAAVGNELFTDFRTAFARANTLSSESGENITIRVLDDLINLADSGCVTGKITLDLDSHNIETCTFTVGKTDASGKVIAEGDLTIIDSSVTKYGMISGVILNGGKLTASNGYSFDITLYGGEAFITNHMTEGLMVYGGTANLSGGSMNEVTVYKGELNISDSRINYLYLNSDSKTNMSDGQVTEATLRGGEMNIMNGIVTELLVQGGKVYIPSSVTGPTISVFDMTAGEAYIESGIFDEFAANIYDSDDTNPKVQIEGGEFNFATFCAKSKGRITLYGGTFNRSLKFGPGSGVRTLGDILPENFMFYKISDGSLIPNSTERIDGESALVKRHIHYYREKIDTGSNIYGECDCGEKAEAYISKSGSNVFYGTFEKAMATATDGDTVRLCQNVECEDDITVTKGVYSSPVTLDLNGKSLRFADGKKLILSGNLYFDIVGNNRGGGSVSYLYQENGTVKLYGGTYRKIESVYTVTNLQPLGYGFKKADGTGWVTQSDTLKELTDVTVKQAPFSANVIVTNDPDGTTTPDVIYLGQTVYFKATFNVDENEPQISSSNPISCAISYFMPNGESRTVASQYNVYGSSTVRSDVLSNTSPDGVYEATLHLEYLGCTVYLYDACLFNVAVCTHNAFTDGVCDICGLPCEHTDVSDDGVCGACQKEFNLRLIKTNGKSLYYTGFKDALTDANLAANKGCTIKLYKDVTMTEAEGYIFLDGGKFTIDLNGYNVNVEIPTKLTVFLKNADLTIQTSVVRNTYTNFYPTIRLDDNGVLRCRHDQEGSYIFLDLLGFVQAKDVTAKMYLGAGVYLSNLSSGGLSMTTGEVLEEGCVFTDTYRKNIFPRSGICNSISSVYVIKCPHEWEGNKCKYCDFVCNHESGYVNGICTTCGRACTHQNLTEDFFCNDCKQQMVVKVETTDGTVTYDPDFTTAMNAAENGTVVTLLTDAELSQNVSINGSGKTVTLNLNGHSAASPGRTIRIGVTDSGEGNKGGTLKMVGNGSILTSVVVNPTGALDWSGWTGGRIKYVAVYRATHVTGSIPSDAYIGELLITGHASERIDKINEITLDGGRFGTVSWQNFLGVAMPLGALLAPGYAFKSEESNTLLPYTDTLAAPYSSIYNVTVVKCEEHDDANGDGKCDYCNEQIVAYVTDKSGTNSYFTDLQDALDTLGNTYTVTLLEDANGSYTAAKGRAIRIRMNGKTINEITFTGEATVSLNDTGSINSVIFSGNAARFTTGNPYIRMKTLTVRDGASWSSILPGDIYGYKIFGDDNSYKWYDKNTINAYVGDKTSVNNVLVDSLPVVDDPNLMLNGEQMAAESTVSACQKLSFRIKANVANGTGGRGSLFIQKNDGSAPIELTAVGNSNEFDCEKNI